MPDCQKLKQVRIKGSVVDGAFSGIHPVAAAAAARLSQVVANVQRSCRAVMPKEHIRSCYSFLIVGVAL
jgi:hypothetical protein